MILLSASDNVFLIVWVVLKMYSYSRQSRFELLVFSTFTKEIDGNLKIITFWSLFFGGGEGVFSCHFLKLAISQ